jgi:hypothetical protein
MILNCQTIIIGDFNINMLTKTSESLALQNLMNKYNLKFIFLGNSTINNTQFYHIWTNAPTQRCYFGST